MLVDPEFLVHADPAFVVPLLDVASGRQAREAAAVYRESLHYSGGDAGVRRWLLGMHAVRADHPELAAEVRAVNLADLEGPTGAWWPSWSNGAHPENFLSRIHPEEHPRRAAAPERPAATPVRAALPPGGDVREVVLTCPDGCQVTATAGFASWVWSLITDEDRGRPSDGFRPFTLTVLGTRLVVVHHTREGTVRVWDAETDRPLGPAFTAHIASVAVGMLDGRSVAVTGGYDKTVRVWDVAEGRPLGQPLTGHTGWVRTVAVASLKERLVAVTGGDDGTVRVWDVADGRPLGQPLTGHTGCVRTVAVASLKERPVAVTGGDDGTVRVWDIADGRPLGQPLTGHTGCVRTVAVASLKERPVAVTGGDDGTVRVWDIADGRPLGQPLTGHSGAVSGVLTACVDGRPVAVSHGGEKEKVRIWDLLTDPHRAGHTAALSAVAVTSLDENPVAVTSGSDGTVRVWHLADGRPVGQAWTGACGALAPAIVDGRQAVVTGDLHVRLWDLTTGRSPGSLGKHRHGRVNTVAVATVEGSVYAITGGNDRMDLDADDDDGTVRFWCLSEGPPNGASMDAMLWAGLRLGTGESQEHLWPKKPSEELPPRGSYRRDEHWVRALAVATVEDRPVAVITQGDYGCVSAVDLTTWQRLPLGYHESWVNAVATATVEGRPLAAIGGEDGTGRVWDLTTGEPVGQHLVGHTAPIRTVSITTLTNRPVVVTGGDDRTVRAWDLSTSRQIGPEMPFPHPVTAVATTSGHDLVVCHGTEVTFFAKGSGARTTRTCPADHAAG
jgi:WD40 repeat protein